MPFWLAFSLFSDGEVAGIYRYDNGECVHHVSEINAFFEEI